ncbi:hypothetical protein SAMN00790413_00529 [Deinococcus hopiensis KR-140]|uniref:Uncharacterized protein n=1 Tax=Deinococcus hopiensis KR-140 TaxID=695939 RepID=A0A1W1V9N1_9DEIO|nr:hypothetical protein SAMN00790413_00529 [Deinococcus hopiensis KR-140]
MLNAAWTKMYGLSEGAAGQKQVAGVLAALQKQGYRKAREKKTGHSHGAHRDFRAREVPRARGTVRSIFRA